MRRMFLIVPLVFALLMPAPITFAADLADQVEQAGEDLDNANAEVAKAMSAYRKAAAELSKAKAIYSSALAKRNKAKKADAIAAAELMEAEARTDAARKKLEETQQALNGEQRLVAQLINQVYRSGPVSQLNVLLGSEDPADLTERLQALSTWTQNKADVIDNLTEIKAKVSAQAFALAQLEAQVAKKKEALAARAAEASAAAEEAKQAKVKVDAAAAIRAKALKDAEKHRDAVRKRYVQLRLEQARLQAQAKSGAKLGAGLTFTGEMMMPVSGRLSGTVGPRRHPVYGYRSCHTGIDIAAPRGTAIRAAADGVVVSVQYGGAYGRHTLIAHGSGLTTMYAHQDSTIVKQGQFVAAGQKIGEVGSTGWSTGPHLHFEIRIDGTAYNPLGWFGGSKTKVNC